MEKFDLIIIGAGPAGIAATLYACRLRMNFLTLSKDIGGLTNFIPDIESYPGFHYLSGLQLTNKFQEHLKDFKPKINLEENVKINGKEKTFDVSRS